MHCHVHHCVPTPVPVPLRPFRPCLSPDRFGRLHQVLPAAPPPHPSRRGLLMIVHQHESMQLQAKTLGQLGRRSQEPSPIGIVQKQCSPPMPPVHHMRPRPCNVDSQCSCHAHPRQYRQPQSVNCLDATPLPFPRRGMPAAQSRSENGVKFGK